MKNIILCILAVLLLSLGSGGCISTRVDVPGVQVAHHFTSPNDIPGCPLGPGNCPSMPFTLPLPSFSQHIDFKPPAGVAVEAQIDSPEISSSTPLTFITALDIEISSDDPNAPSPATLAHYTPDTPQASISITPAVIDILPYLRGNTTFAITVTGTVPDNEVPLDVTIGISGSISYEKSL